MPRRLLITVAVLTLPLLFTGCKKQAQCASGDTPEVCKAFQECLKSDISAEVCRMGEQDASRSRKDLAPAYNGAAEALGGSSSPKH